MVHLIYPHLFCFSYHRSSDAIPPSWTDWKQTHPGHATHAQSYEYAGQDWDAIFEVKSLGDSQGLLLYGAVREEEKPQSTEVLAQLKQHFSRIQGSIGQTWLVLSRWQPDHPGEGDRQGLDQAFQDIAKLWTIESWGNEEKFLGNVLRSAVLPNGEWLWVCLAEDSQTMEAVSNFYYDLQRLFYYQHKIRWSHEQSCKIKEILSQETFFPLTHEIIPASQIKLTEATALKGDFYELRQVLYDNMQKLDRHTRGLEGLSLQLQTLKTNLRAYEKRSQRIEQRCANYPFKTDVQHWSDFAGNQAVYYQEQIQQDIESLSPGLRVREQHIKTLQVLVAAAQGERDRNIENLVGGAGLGIGVSSAAAGAWAGHTSGPWQTFSVSLALGLLFGVGSYLLLRRYRT
jgi:hypothetical protein